MGNEKYISILKNNTETLIEFLCAFYIEEYDSKYIIYSKNKSSWNNKTIVNVGKIKIINGRECLSNIDDYVEWSKIRNILNNINKYGMEGVING